MAARLRLSSRCSCSLRRASALTAACLALTSLRRCALAASVSCADDSLELSDSDSLRQLELDDDSDEYDSESPDSDRSLRRRLRVASRRSRFLRLRLLSAR